MIVQVKGKDVFISCKNTDEHGVQTRDAEIAAQVYDFLTGKGLNVFLSTFTLEQLGASAYTREIDSALESATVLLAIGTSAHHLKSEWVRYEWDSFSNAIRSGSKPNGRVFTYIEGMPITALPWALRHTQTFVHGKDPLERLYNFISKALRPLAEQREREEKELLERELGVERGEAERSPEIPKMVSSVPSKPSEAEHVTTPPLSSGGTGDKSLSKQVIAFLAVATVLVVTGLIYLATKPSKLPPPQPAPIAAVTPGPPAIATPTAEEKARSTPEVAVKPTAQPTASMAMAIPSPSISATPTPQPTTPSPTPSAAESLAQAKSYLDAKDFAKALPLLQKAADAGDTDAMLNLGWLYANGNGGGQDFGKSREWYQKAADAGNTDAMLNLGWLYANGYGGFTDFDKAREWYQKAADAGNTDAMLNLGELYANGDGGGQDFGKAREWYQKAADAGNTDAMLNLGGLYEVGKGVAQDYRKARELYRKAADAGNTDGMDKLGGLYANGKGVAQDYRKAREWYQKAADAGNADAMQNLGWLYEDGKGVAQDFNKASEWQQKAAKAFVSKP